MTNPPPDPTAPGHPQSPAPGYSQQPAAGYPQQPTSGYPQAPTTGQPGFPSQEGHPQPPDGGYAQPSAGYPQQFGGSGYPQHLWPEHAQPRVAAQPVVPQRAKGSAALGVLALVLAFAGLVAPFLPFSNLIDRFPVRQYLAFPFAVPALALAITTLATDRRGKPAAAIGMMIAFLALIVGAIMVYNYDFR